MMKTNKQNRIISIYIIIAVNYAIYALDIFLPLSILYLDHQSPYFFQFLTSAFCHGSFAHLTGNMFFIFFFGKLIEEEFGDKAITIIYLSSALIVNISNFLISDIGGFSLGASGVVFSFFTITLALKLSQKSDWRSWIELLVLGPFIISYLFSELSLVESEDNIGHLAHILGGISGFILFYLFRKT